MEILEILAIIAIASGVLGYVFYGNKKSNLPNNNSAPNDTVKELSEKEIQLKQLEYLKNIQYQSERSAKNLAFITWLIVISMIISFFTIVSNS